MNKILAWFEDFGKSHGGWTHIFAALTTVLITLWYQDQSFHDAVWALYQAMPSWAHNLIAVAISALMWYWKAKKAQREVWSPEERAQKLKEEKP